MLVGQLLDLINLSKKLEEAKTHLLKVSEDLNVPDAFNILE